MIYLYLIFVFLFIFFTHPFEGSGDFYHHVNTGRYILQHLSLPNLDEFSHTAYGLPWVAHSWLSGVIFYLIFHYFGEFGIRVLVSLCAMLTFWLIYLLLKKLKISFKAALLSLFLILIPFSMRFPQRPEIFIYPLAICLLLLDQYRKKFKALIIFFPIIILLWANLYGASTVLGLAIIFMLILKQLYHDRFKLSSESKRFYLFCFLSIFASYFNGYGLKSLLYIYFYIPKVSVYEAEWAGIFKIWQTFPDSLLISYQYYILLFIIYLILFLFTVIPAWAKIKSDRFLIFLSFALVVPFFSFRHAALAVILSSPLLAKALTYHLETRRLFLPGLALTGGLLMLIITFQVNPPELKTPANTSLDNMVKFIKEKQLSGKAFNHLHFGGFITYNFYPGIKVFYDTRDELFLNTRAYQDLYQVSSSGQGLLALLDKYAIDIIIADIVTDNLPYRDLLYSPNWQIVFFSDRYLVAIPKRIAQQKKLASISSIDPFSPTGAKPGKELEAVSYYQSLVTSDPDSVNNKIYLASTLLGLGKFDKAADILSSVNPSSGSTSKIISYERDYLLSQVFLYKNDCQNAKQKLDSAKSALKSIYILPVDRNITDKTNKGYAFYFLSCQKDLDQAKKYLNKYLSSSLTPLEKAVTQKEFNELEVISKSSPLPSVARDDVLK